MSDVVISVENLGKKYVLGPAERQRYVALRDVLSDKFRNLFQNRNGVKEEEFWALGDVSFDIRAGEVLGVIGRNGAGKSTLLKVLSRITEPTRGRVTIDGHVASLLEVGTGFHPELTGRENIFLNGAILGMGRAEIKKRFDEIVAFAEVEKFLDTPVKRYSSGMYVRLAFAVAAHLEPEILIVDEVLAVGDAQFQKKCLGKMQDVSNKDGRTVIFVSHNMASVTELCGRCILLNKGMVQLDGDPASVVKEYLGGDSKNKAEMRWSGSAAPGNQSLKLRCVRLSQPPGVANAHVNIAEPVEIEMETELLVQLPELNLSIKVLSMEGRVLMHTFNLITEASRLKPGLHLHTCRLPAHLFNAGTYFLDVAADIPHVQILFLLEQVLSWTVSDFTPEASRYGLQGGVIGPKLAHWQFEQVDEMSAASRSSSFAP